MPCERMDDECIALCNTSERLASNQISKDYRLFIWRLLRAKPFLTRLLNCTEDVPKYRSSDSARAETYFAFVYSDLAAMRMGMSESASFQNEKNS
jgi:hypothetical protein